MSRLRVGVVGCGAIAQIHHLPNLTALHEHFEVSVVCDVSPAAAAAAARRFHVPRHLTDYRELLAADLDAVLLCHTDPKTEAAVAVLEAGKHLFIEKPLCFSLPEIDAMIAAQRAAGTVAQAGYMKVYDPAFELAQRAVREMDEIRFVQVNHLHPDNALHLRQFDLRRFDDYPAAAIEQTGAARSVAVRQAIGDATPEVQRAFSLLSGSMIHDLYTMRAMLGLPRAVVSAEIWRDGRAVTFTLEYPSGARCVATWIDLPDLWDFYETLEIYGDAQRVVLSYPTGFARGIPCTLVLQGMDDEGRAYRTEPAVDWESAFLRELRHFHECIVDGTANRTPLAAARDDISLIIDILRKYRE
jgi:predicted dehydrogenase